MARIPQTEIDRLKHEVSIQRLAEAKGIKLRPHGQGNLIGLCPWHDDRSPSMVLTPSKNLWHCLGACGEGGSVIDWVMKDQGVSFRHAVELLREDPRAATARSSAKVSTTRKLPPPVHVDATDQEAFEQVVSFYHQTLLDSPEALAYLEGRGLAPARPLAELFRLGYANRTLGYRLPFRNRAEGAELRDKLERLGLLRKSGHEHLTGRIIVPISDRDGKLVQLYGRKVNPRSAIPDHLYLPRPQRGVWNIQALADTEEAILCESHIDGLTFHHAGYRKVTTSFGANGFTNEMLEAFQHHGIRRVLIAYDRDDAGDASARKLADKLMPQGIDCYRVKLPHGLDVNEYALKVTPASRSLGILLRSAEWMGQGKPPSQGRIAITIEPPSAAAAKEESPAEPPAQPELPSPAEAPPPSSLAACPEPPPEASPTPSVPESLPVEVSEGIITTTIGDRFYRVIGLTNNLTLGQLRINLMVRKGDIFHVDTLDIYAQRFRGRFIEQASRDLEIDEKILKADLGRLLLKLEELQEAEIKKTAEPGEKVYQMTEDERREALELLKDPKLIDRILADLELMGVVGEEVNKLTALLAATSRKDTRPLAIIIQSSSAAGRTMLMDAILALIPEEERVRYSALTGQALFYLGDKDLRHKILAISEEEGASRASYALKLLQSEGKLSIASTGKDPVTGKLVANEYVVEGPVMIFMTTTAVEIDEELQNRCIILTVDEDREQTRAIHRMQREQETLEGYFAQQSKEHRIKLHQNAQRLLRPIVVRNPYARELTFLDTKTRTRRDHMKYLSLIRAVAMLRQYQRPRRLDTNPDTGQQVEHIDVEVDDIAVANRIAHQVLGRSLSELSATTERLLFKVEDMVGEARERLKVRRKDYRFTRRDVREYTGWGDFQVRKHLQKLVSLEYVIVHRGGRGQSFEYELVYDGQGKDRRPFLIGLIDVKDLSTTPLSPTTTTPNLERKSGGVVHENKGVEHPLSPQRAPIEPGSSTPSNGGNGTSPKASSDSRSNPPGNAYIGEEKGGTSQTYSYSHGRSGVAGRKTSGS